MTALPRRLGRYELLYELARGGMGVVYLARLRSVGGFSRLVAVKQCLPEHTRDKDFVAMFLDEARLAARVHHPSVVPTLDVEHQRDALFLAMEYVEGERVVDVVRAAGAQAGAVPLAIALRIMVDALHGLHAAHILEDSDGAPLGLVHRDVSPQNILVGYDGLTRILDFGVARAERRLTRTLVGGIPKGKLAYMAPEQLLEMPLDRRADVFAAGLVAWELLVGSRLFDANTETQLVSQVLEKPIVPPSSRRSDVPSSLDAVVLRALERDADRRTRTALDFANELERCGLSVATHQTVANFVREVLREQRAHRLALRRRVEAMPPLPEPSSPQDTAPNNNPHASHAAPAAKTVALDMATTRAIASVSATASPGSVGVWGATAPQPTAGASTTHGALHPPAPFGALASLTSLPGAVQTASPAIAREPRSPLVYLAVGMTLLGLAFGVAGVAARDRARRERAALASIDMPAAVPVLPTRSGLYARTDAPLEMIGDAAVLETPTASSIDASVGAPSSVRALRRHRASRPHSTAPPGVEF
jgi:serine/threonine protein kinase